MGGLWGASDVGRTTSWYCSTYKGENSASKCGLLTDCLSWFFATMSKHLLKFALGHPKSRSRRIRECLVAPWLIDWRIASNSMPPRNAQKT
jgi:hypothetical protein